MGCSGEKPRPKGLGEWYPEHIMSYNKYRGDKTVHFLYFEDLKKDLLTEVKKMAAFMEIPLTDEKAVDITQKNVFDSMLSRAEVLANDTMRFIRKANLRKGQVGAWKDHFTVRQSERVDALMAERLKGADVKFTYE